MILTVTLNPSIDMSYRFDTLKIDQVNRVTDVSKTAGGKGLNVTNVLNQLACPVTATGFLGGFLGDQLASLLDAKEIKHQFVPIAVETRNSIALLHDNGQQTEVLESGPVISEDEAQQFLATFAELLPQVELVTISGSLPRGLPDDFYNQLIGLANKANVPVMLDSSQKALEQALATDNKLFLVKPNSDEISQLLNCDFHALSIADQLSKLSDPYFSNVEWLVVSLGATGAIARHEDNYYLATIPKVDAINPVGSGDSTIAGFAYAFSQGVTGMDLLRAGMTTGVLNAMTPETGSILGGSFDQIYNAISITSL